MLDVSVYFKFMQLDDGETETNGTCKTLNHCPAKLVALKLAIPEEALHDVVGTCAVTSREKAAKSEMKIIIDLKGRFNFNFLLQEL